MPNTFLSPSVIAREALVLLQSNLVTQRLFSRRYEADLNPGSKVGDTVLIRRRGRGVVTEYDGSTQPTVQDINETSIPVKLEKHFDATIRITDRERTLSLVDFSEQVLAPRMIEMGEKIDQYGLSKLVHLPNVAGPAEFGIATAAVSVPTTIADWASCDKTLNDLKVPLNPRVGIISTTQKATILSQDAFVGVDKSGDDSALRAARVGPVMNFDLYMGQNVDTSTFTSGGATAGGTIVGSGTPSIVAAGSVAIPFTAAAPVTTGKHFVGDIIRIFFAGSTGEYQDCVVRGPNGNEARGADAVTFNASGAGTVYIQEPLRQNIANGASISLYRANGKTRKNHGALFHPDAFAFVAVPLDLPVGTPASYVSDPSSNLSMRAVFTYDRAFKGDILSLDCLVGAAMVDGRLGAQIVQHLT